MITSKTDHCKTLEEFYVSIREQQEEYHGMHYCDQHDMIRRLMVDCDTYKELGVHQGATAANALIHCNPTKVELVDISLEKYNWSKDLFRTYCDDNDIELVVKESSSIKPKSRSRTDLLLIDSLHKPDYLTQELRYHAEYVNKYIVFHDTSMLNRTPNDALYKVIEKFCNELNPWEIIERHTDNVGCMAIKRTV